MGDFSSTTLPTTASPEIELYEEVER